MFSPYDNDYVIISEHRTFCYFITTELHAEQDTPLLNLIRAKINRETLCKLNCGKKNAELSALFKEELWPPRG